MAINLYPEMNSKISGLLRLSDQPAQMYASALIDAYRASGLEPDEIPHWVPVSERLPEPGERVICKWGKFIGEGFRKEMGGWERYYCLPLLDAKVDHWMPLPQSPKEER